MGVLNLNAHSIQFALRWRSEEEVLSGAGEETCGNTRCTHHEPSRALPKPPLKTVELPFAYEEHDEQKFALVKVVLCDRCLKKLMWKREKEKETAQGATMANVDSLPEKSLDETSRLEHKKEDNSGHRTSHRNNDAQTTRESRHKRHSRSRSPSHRRHSESKRSRRRSREPSSRKHDSGE